MTFCLNDSDWIAINAIASIILTIVLIIVTYIVGKRQSQMQKNAIRVQMHDKYITIYEILEKESRTYDHSYANLRFVLSNSKMSFIYSDLSAFWNIMPSAKQLFPEKEFQLLFNYCSRLDLYYLNLESLCNELSDNIEKLDIEILLKLREILKGQRSQVLKFLAEYEKLGLGSDYLFDIEVFKGAIIELENLEKNKILQVIGRYSNLSNIL